VKALLTEPDGHYDGNTGGRGGDPARLAPARHSAVPCPLDLAGAQAALDPGTLALSYSVGEEETDLFAFVRRAP